MKRQIMLQKCILMVCCLGFGVVMTTAVSYGAGIIETEK